MESWKWLTKSEAPSVTFGEHIWLSLLGSELEAGTEGREVGHHG